LLLIPVGEQTAYRGLSLLTVREEGGGGGAEECDDEMVQKVNVVIYVCRRIYYWANIFAYTCLSGIEIKSKPVIWFLNLSNGHPNFFQFLHYIVKQNKLQSSAFAKYVFMVCILTMTGDVLWLQKNV